MPILANARHERFAQEIAKGIPASTAYVTAGYKPNDGNACVLKGKQRIAARVGEILGKAAESTGVSVESLTRELFRVLEQAGSLKADAAGTNAWRQTVMDIAKLNGLIVEQQEVRHGRLDGLPTDERERLVELFNRELTRRSGRIVEGEKPRQDQHLLS